MTRYEKFFGNYLKKEDLKGDTVVTVVEVKPEPVGEEEKLVCHLKEFDRPLVLNKGNADAIAEIVGSEEIEDWVGKKITLFVDPGVKYKGQRVGGIRVRVPGQGVREAEAEALL